MRGKRRGGQPPAQEDEHFLHEIRHAVCACHPTSEVRTTEAQCIRALPGSPSNSGGQLGL